jgi:putative transposase
MIIRRSKLNINFSTKSKQNKLEEIIEEYSSIVNQYIMYYKNYYKEEQKLPKFSIVKIETWLSSRMQQCAGKQALEIIRSIQKKNNEIRYKRYKKAYSYFKKRNRQIKFINKRYKELKINFKWLIKPEFKNKTINLDSRFIEIQEGKNNFDIWFKFGSIGNKTIIYLPSKKHKHFLKYYNNKKWEMLKSTRLYKTKDKYYIDVFFKTKKEEPKGNTDLSIDLGINSLITTSNKKQYGLNFKNLLNKLNRKKQKSKRWNRTLVEIKNYIGREINKLDLQNVKNLVLENLKNISKNTKGKVNKTTRKYLSKWNRSLIYQRLENLCEINRVNIAWINPAFTSRVCPICENLDKQNRHGKIFKCTKCGHSENADIIGATNILRSFYEEFIVPFPIKT